MKTLEDLKSKHQEVKELLVDVVEFLNSEDSYKLSPAEKGLVIQYRVGLETATSALSNLSFNSNLSCDFSSSTMWPLLLSSLYSSPLFGSSSSSSFQFKELSDTLPIEETKKDE